MAKRQRLILPTLATCLALPLVAWDVYLAPLRIGYDAGTPVWPFQMPSILLVIFDAPAVLLARPFLDLFRAYSALAHGALILIATPLIWYWIGDRIDFGALRPPYRYPRLLGALLLIVAVVMAALTVREFGYTNAWWQTYGGLPARRWVLLMDASPTAWELVIVVCCLSVGLRLFRREKLLPVSTARRDHKVTLIAILVWSAAFALTPAVEAMRNYNHADMSRGDLDPDSCVIDAATGCMHGSVVTSAGAPIRGVFLDLVPLTAPANTHPTMKDWTYADRKGRYSFDNLEPGEYLVGVHIRSAPSAEQPYPTTFYPGAEQDADAAHLHIEANKKIALSPLKVRSLTLTKFTVEIRWPDGSHPLRSNLLVRNKSFNQQATIGDSAPQIDNGTGSFTLPDHSDYEVHAAVECDEISEIGQRETPYVPLRVTDRAEPAHLVLTLPGFPCTLWSSQGR
jgi:hypothetical protein